MEIPLVRYILVVFTSNILQNTHSDEVESNQNQHNSGIISLKKLLRHEQNYQIISPFRRQMNLPIDMMKEWDKLAKGKKTKQDSFFEPYWAEGDWVFHREKLSSMPVKVTPPDSDEVITQTTRTTPRLTGTTPVYKECELRCLSIYDSFGTVCGKRLNFKTWQSEYKNFIDMCDLEYENCREPLSMWYPVHRSRCGERKKVVLFSADSKKFVERADSWAPLNATKFDLDALTTSRRKKKA